jgi:hypothetical protein
MNAWTAALTTDTIARSIAEAHMTWLASAEPGSRLVRHLDTNEIGHVYPDVRTTPIGWALLATRTSSRPHRPPSVATPSTGSSA